MAVQGIASAPVGSPGGFRPDSGASPAPAPQAQSSPEPVAASAPPPSGESTRQLVDRANRLAEERHLQYRFGVRELSGFSFVEIQDRNTGEVVRTFPPEQLLDVHDRLAEQIGLLLDQEA